jgi:hypothetical protein
MYIGVLWFSRRSAILALQFFDEKMTILPVDHHSDHKVGPIVFILGKNIAKCKDMPYKRRSAEIGNSKWPTKDFFGLIFHYKNNTFAYSSP